MESSNVPDHKLATIKFSRENLHPGTEPWSKTCKQVKAAMEEHGCFVALYDDHLSPRVHSDVFDALEELFDLPTGTKVQNKSVKPLYGYVGQIPFLPLYESMGIDDANTFDGVQSFANVMWPNGNPSFCEKVIPYTRLAVELEQVAVKMLFETYGVEKYYDSDYLKCAGYLSRVMKYKGGEQNEKKLGFVAHTDKSFMSTIHQNQINGLEIKAKDGEWFSVDLPPSAIVVMAGDAIMAWSNGRIKSPHHRVTMEGKGPRYSIAQFSFIEGTVRTPEELVDDENPLQYKPFNSLEYLDFFSKEENRRLEFALKKFCGVN